MTGKIVQNKHYTAYYDDDGNLHREDGPAAIYEDGTKEWYIHGKEHRVDGPAIEFEDGEKHWYLHGLPHREDGPAIERANGTRYWLINNQLHREDGPAVMYDNGTKWWYIHGKDITDEVECWKNNMGITNDEFTPEESSLFVLYFGNSQ